MNRQKHFYHVRLLIETVLLIPYIAMLQFGSIEGIPVGQYIVEQLTR